MYYPRVTKCTCIALAKSHCWTRLSLALQKVSYCNRRSYTVGGTLAVGNACSPKTTSEDKEWKIVWAQPGKETTKIEKSTSKKNETFCPRVDEQKMGGKSINFK